MKASDYFFGKGFFQPGGDGFGYTPDGFFFNSWRDVWTAVTTQGHILSQYATHVMGERKRVKLLPFGRIRIDLDVVPPIVESVYPRWLGWGIAISIGFAFWAGVLLTTLQR